MKTFIGVHSNRNRYTLALAGVLLLVAMPAGVVTPVEVAKLLADDGATNDFFGFSVALSGDTAVIGAHFDDDAGFDSGSAYVFASDPVIVAIEDLIAIVVSLNLQQGIENALDAKLDAAIQSLDDVNQNNDVAAFNMLNTFIQNVEAQRGSKLTDAAATQLVAGAQAIIDLLTI